MARRSQGPCSSCIFQIIAIVVVLAIIAAFVFSLIYTVEQVGWADKEGILSDFDSKYAPEDTFRSVGMEGWKLWDVLLWILKSGNHEPKQREPFKIL